ncbi:MAG: hypothetical protein WB765_13480 [Acidimicrobiales bacterium]
MRMSASGAAGWVRVGVGVLLAAAPQMFVDRFVEDESSGTLVLFARTIGVRDLALGLGTLAAERSGSTADLQRWVRAGLISDSLDFLFGLASTRLIGRVGVAKATATVVPVIALDLLGLRKLAASTD